MTEKKKDNTEQKLEKDEDSIPSRQRNRSLDNRTVRNVSPMGMRVLVQLQHETMTEGGLYIPEGAKKNFSESLLARVLEVASAHDQETDEETNVSGIPFGATVLIPKEAGTTLPWDDSMRIVDTKDILAVIEEMVVS